MVAPSAAGASFDVLLAFSLDEAAQKRVETRVSTINEELSRIEKQAKKSGESINKMGDVSAKGADKTAKSIGMVGAQLANLESRIKKTTAVTSQEIEKQIAKYKKLEETAKQARTKAALVSGTAARGANIAGQTLVAGVGLVGGILAEANQYAKNAKEATAATIAWTDATKQLATARGRIDAVLLREAIPLLQKAAQLATQAASFVEKNPEIVRAALKAGVILAGLGAVGLAVTKGIKLVADVAYIAAVATELIAAKLQDKAADKMLLAAAGQGKGAVVGAVGKVAAGVAGTTVAGLSVATIGTTVAATVAAFVATGALVTISTRLAAPLRKAAGLQDFLPKIAGGIGLVAGKALGDDPAEIQRKATIFAALIGRITGDIDKSSPLWLKAANSVKKTADIVADAANELSDKDMQIAKAFGDWKNEDAKIVQDAMAERIKITTDGQKELSNITANYQSQVAKIGSSSASAASGIRSRFVVESAKAETQYATDRANIVRDSGENIRQIEEQHQEDMRELAKDHNQKMGDLLNDRDALGLVKEQQAYDDARSEKERAVNAEIAQTKRETAIRLQELAISFAQERAERQRQLAEDLKQNAIQRAEQMAEAAAQYQAELKQSREATAQKLKDIAEASNSERLRRREQFLATIRDIDASLLGERTMKNNYYRAMLTDAQSFMQSYRSALGSTSAAGIGTASGGSASSGTSSGGGAIGTAAQQAALDLWNKLRGKATGGYVENSGIYKLAESGREFVLNNQITRAAEKIIGGNLTQESLIAALSGSRANVNYNDQRRFNSGISARDRRAIANDTQSLLENLIRT